MFYDERVWVVFWAVVKRPGVVSPKLKYDYDLTCYSTLHSYILIRSIFSGITTLVFFIEIRPTLVIACTVLFYTI